MAFYAAESTDIRGGTRAKVRRGKAKTGEGKDGERPLFTIVAVHDTAADVPTTIVRGVGLFLLEEIFERHSFAREGISNNSFASCDISGLIIVSEQLR